MASLAQAAYAQSARCRLKPMTACAPPPPRKPPDDLLLLTELAPHLLLTPVPLVLNAPLVLFDARYLLLLWLRFRPALL